MPRIHLAPILAFLSLALVTGSAEATSIYETIPEHNGAAVALGSVFPQPPVVVGVFASIPASESLTLGRISGTFGNSVYSSSAGVDLYLGNGGATFDDLLVARCIKGDACYSAPIDNWTHTFTPADIAVLSGFAGPLVLTAVQTSETVIRLGPTTLLATSVLVPEPGTALLLGLGMIGLGSRRAGR